MVALWIWEGFFSRMPLLHPFLFRKVRTFTLILVVGFVGGMLFYALQAFFHVYVQELFTSDPIEVAINLIPMNAAINIGSVIGALILPWLAPRVGTNSILAFAVGLQLLFIPLLCLANADRHAMALTFSALGGIGTWSAARSGKRTVLTPSRRGRRRNKYRHSRAACLSG
jgi:MFS family permease